MKTTEWILEDSDRIEDDCLLEEISDCGIYQIMSDPSVIGVGVYKNDAYWVKESFVIGLSIPECNNLFDELMNEAKAFATSQSPNQLILFA